jgi:D-arabinonate dehydratase
MRIPVETPVIVGGGLRIAEREYLLVAVDTDAGLTGVGWSFARGGDLAGAVEQHLRPVLEQQDPLDTERLWEAMDDAALAAGRHAAVARAMSALDIALWDLKGQILGLPLHRLLGGYRVEVPVLMAAMYYTDGRRPEDDAREAAQFAEQGVRWLKMMGGAAPFTEDAARLRAVRQAIGPDLHLAFDVNGAWRDYATAMGHARELEDVQLAFIEEPLPPKDLPGVLMLAADSPVPIAVGESVTSRHEFKDLAASALILRPDATVVGGITEWVKVHALATTAHRLVIPHYFPYVHIHVAAGLSEVQAVECITTAGGISAFHRVVHTPLRPAGGKLRAPDGPGLGLVPNWHAIEHYAVR